MRRREYFLLAKCAVALIEKSDDGLMLLADEGDKIGPPVAIEVNDRHMDRAVPLIDARRDELGPGPIRRAIFQVQDLPRLPPSKHGDNQVQPAVRIEIRGLHVSDTAHTFKNRNRVEATAIDRPQPNYVAEPA